MSFIEDKFYSRDKKEYELQENISFMKWLLMSISSGTRVNRYTELNDMQGLIDHLTNFYQIKYPDFTLEEIPHNPWGEKVKELEEMDIKLTVPQMILRLPWKEEELMECEYSRGSSSGNYSEYENGRTVHKSWIGISLYNKRNKKEEYSIQYNPQDGMIIASEIKQFINHDLETVLQYLKKHPTILDYHELELAVDTNHFEIELRHRLLQLTALKILYSSSKPEIGYKRAKKFIEEMNQELGLLLTTKDIEKAYQRYEGEKKFLKAAFDLNHVAKNHPNQKDLKILKIDHKKRIRTD